jgi:hypothetical protein
MLSGHIAAATIVPSGTRVPCHLALEEMAMLAQKPDPVSDRKPLILFSSRFKH